MLRLKVRRKLLERVTRASPRLAASLSTSASVSVTDPQKPTREPAAASSEAAAQDQSTETTFESWTRFRPSRPRTPSDAVSTDVDSTAPVSPKVAYSIPREKLRLLVDLYHQSRNYITDQNLDKRIDDAFATRGQSVEEDRYGTLKGDLKTKQQAADFVRDVRHKDSSARVKQVHAVLWGTQVDGTPALEGVEDKREALIHTDRISNSIRKSMKNES